LNRRKLLQGLIASTALIKANASTATTNKAKSNRFDVVVVGAGVFGTWSAWCLSQAGLSVALIDQSSPGHSGSSSGGESRITRTGYGGNELYSEWSYRSLNEWKKLSEESSLPLFHPLGMLMVHEQEDAYVKLSKQVLTKLEIPFDSLDAKALRDRYPVMAVKDSEFGMLEPLSGGLMARRAVQTLATKAVSAGVQFYQGKVAPIFTKQGHNGSLLDIQLTQNGKHSSVQADNFVFACGPWLDRACPDAMADKLFVTRQEIFYFNANRSITGSLPTWATLPHYGLPDIEGRGFKVANDSHGSRVNPDTQNRNVSEESIAQTREFLANRFPSLANQPLLESRVCQYENSSNGDFVIDQHPGLDNTYVVGGGSGHGFKHGPAVGQHVAELVLKRAKTIPIFRLSAKASIQNRKVH
jgi:glycine/D-amino acid oxidase-like deaminating enzyme